MKMNLKKTALILGLSTTFAMSSAMAAKKGGDSGGGGDSLIDRKTGEIVSIADPLAEKKISYKRVQFSKELITELNLLAQLLWSFQLPKNRYELMTSEENVDYRLVDEIPNLDQCGERLSYKQLSSEDFKIAQSACTIGAVTYLKRSHYNELNQKSSKRELALLMLHEGLRRVSSVSEEDLITISNGAREMAKIYDAQKLGKFELLSVEQKEALRNLLETIFYTKLNGYGELPTIKTALSTLDISDYGGVINKETSKISNTAKVGVGVYVTKMEIGENAEISNLSYGESYYKDLRLKAYPSLKISRNIGANVKISNSELSNGSFTIEDDTQIINSVLSFGSDYTLGKSSYFGNSFFRVGRMLPSKFGDRMVVKNSHLDFEGAKFEDNVRFINVKNAKFQSDYYNAVTNPRAYTIFVFKKDAYFDLNDKIVCSKENAFKGEKKILRSGDFDIYSLNDLTSLCTNK